MPPLRLFLIACLCAPLCISAQQKKNLPVFGKIDKSELDLSVCEFDPEATAIVLADVGTYNVDLRGSEPYFEFRRHVRIKILKDEGIPYANIRIPYIHYGNAEQIVNLSAFTYNVDASGNLQAT